MEFHWRKIVSGKEKKVYTKESEWIIQNNLESENSIENSVSLEEDSVPQDNKPEDG